MTDDMEFSGLLTYAEAAKELGISKSTIVRLCAEGKIRVYVLAPRCHRIDPKSLGAYLRESVKQTAVLSVPAGRLTKRRSEALGNGLPLADRLKQAQKRFSTKSKPGD